MNDKTLKQNVEDELDWQPAINASNIGVAVEAGVVTLTGHVPSYAVKYNVERSVKRVSGVRGVVEHLEVRLAGDDAVSDDEVAKRALQSLNWATLVPRDSVQVSVQGGWITLTGELSWQYQKTAAAAAVRNLYGVKGVFNEIALKAQPLPGDIKTRIQNALKRSAELEGKDIRVDVVGETVTLAGSVHSWYERERAEDAAWMAPGVRAVVDHLQVA
jgi:osmotically-inducible protein OsmY